MTNNHTSHKRTVAERTLRPESLMMGIDDCMVRLSIGVEHPEDLIADLEQALACV